MREIAIFYAVLVAATLLAVVCVAGINWAGQFGEAARLGAAFVTVFVVTPPSAWLIALFVDRWG